MTDRKVTNLSQRKQLAFQATSSKITEDDTGKMKRPGKAGNLIPVKNRNKQGLP